MSLTTSSVLLTMAIATSKSQVLLLILIASLANIHECTSSSIPRKVVLSSNGQRVTSEKINIGHCYRADCRERESVDPNGAKCYCCMYDGTCWTTSDLCEFKCKGKVL